MTVVKERLSWLIVGGKQEGGEGERGGGHSDRVSDARAPTDRWKSQRAELTLLSASPMSFFDGSDVNNSHLNLSIKLINSHQTTSPT